MNDRIDNYTSESVDKIVKQMLPLASTMEGYFNKGVGIYGAGFVGTWACTYLKSIGAKVSIFIDNDANKTGKSIQNVPIVLPSDSIVNSLSSIFIAARHDVKNVELLMQNKCSNLLSFDGYYVIRNYQRLCSIRDDFLSDNKSIETFNAILIAMLTSSLKSCRAVMEKDMYFHLPEFSGTFDDIFVDAGAFVGDTVERFIWENLGTFKHIYAFEPGVKQFTALQKRMDRLAEEWAFELSNVSLEQAGLASESGEMNCMYVNDHPLRHALGSDEQVKNQENKQSCSVYSLDSYLKGKPVTFIKVDIEGMEMDFLYGAKNTICKFKPKMALCAYHYPSDLYEIAEYVHSLVPEYKFSLRQHAPIFGDFVLYCYID
ncbi:MAG: FkbM family methyltransferase [Bacteroidota bacterium]